jgi:predicted hotdog family 3-hydroxylacyl-ACP dehydratase
MRYPTIETLLPHRGVMLLLDGVLDDGPEFIRTQARTRRDAWYADASGNMPAWVGIELMAQTIAAFVGLPRRRYGEALKIGFLLGTRKYSCTVPAFPGDAMLEINANLVFREANGLGAFDCSVIHAGEILARGAIKVFEPADAQRFIEEHS